MHVAYNRQRFAAALREVGACRGDAIFSHSNIGFFGWPEEGSTPAAACETILGAIQDVLGPEGTFVTPTFSYSFCREQPFDPAHTPSTCGAFSEYVRKHSDSVRSCDPNFSVAAIGGRAQELTANVSQESFGVDSFWDRFLQRDGLVCNMNLHRGSTFFHYVERRLQVPYRFDKAFHGSIIIDGQSRSATSIFFCRDLSNPLAHVDPGPFDALARESGLSNSATVGRGTLVAILAADVYRIIAETLPHRPWFLTAGDSVQQNPTSERLLEPEPVT